MKALCEIMTFTCYCVFQMEQTSLGDLFIKRYIGKLTRENSDCLEFWYEDNNEFMIFSIVTTKY